MTSVGDILDASYAAYNFAGKYIGLNEEVKFLDTLINTGVVTYAGRVDPISLIAEGDTVSQRGGESIRAHGVELRYTMNANGTALINTGRVIVFADSECRGAAPSASDVLELTGATGSTLSPWNHLGAARFNILYDSGPVSMVTGDASQLVAKTVVLPFKEHIRYSGAAGLIANSYENNLFILSMGDTVTNGPSFVYDARLHYVDN